MDRDALGEVAGLDRAQPEALRQWSRCRGVGYVARVEVDRAGRPRVSVPRECSAHGLVVLERSRSSRVRDVEDLVEEMQMLRVDVVLEDPAVALEPRPGDDPAAVPPEPERPLGLAPLVLAQAPRDVADVPLRTGA